VISATFSAHDPTGGYAASHAEGFDVHVDCSGSLAHDARLAARTAKLADCFDGWPAGLQRLLRRSAARQHAAADASAQADSASLGVAQPGG